MGFFVSRAISSEEWGEWQVMHSPEATGGWTSFLENAALSWQEKHSTGSADVSSLGFFEECGL
jgi:hypothetical protein